MASPRRLPPAGRDPALLFRALAVGEEKQLLGVFTGFSVARIGTLFAAQQSGRSTLLVGWLRGRPVGMASLEWMGPRHPEPRAIYPDCVELHSVEVEATLRSDGIGSRLLAFCEGMAIGRGFVCTGLGVAVDNVHAYALCLRRGYAERQRVEYEAVPGSAPEPARLRFLVKQL